MERRWFFARVAAAGLAVSALARSVKAKVTGLPSDPDGERKEAGENEILLPQFTKASDYSLEQALLDRKTERSFDGDKSLSMEQISRVLWAANGQNRDDGHRTTPSALARYPVDVYVALPEGIYLYDHSGHKLTKKSGEDIRRMVPLTQPGLKRAAMQVLYVFNSTRVIGSDESWADLEIGCMVQNVYMMAAQLGLGSTVFALVKYGKVTEKLALGDKEELRIAQAVGHIK